MHFCSLPAKFLEGNLSHPFEISLGFDDALLTAEYIRNPPLTLPKYSCCLNNWVYKSKFNAHQLRKFWMFSVFLIKSIFYFQVCMELSNMGCLSISAPPSNASTIKMGGVFPWRGTPAAMSLNVKFCVVNSPSVRKLSEKNCFISTCFYVFFYWLIVD